MSVLIKGMDKETAVRICAYTGVRMDDSDFVPVPKHGDLIDADKLVELCDIMADKCDGIGASIWHQFKTTVEWSPIVIPAEEGE